MDCLPHVKMVLCTVVTGSVAVGFGWHGMPLNTSNPDLWPFDFETGLRVASKVGNLPTKFVYARALRSGITGYTADRQADKSNTYCRLRYGRGHNKCGMFTGAVSLPQLLA